MPLLVLSRARGASACLTTGLVARPASAALVAGSCLRLHHRRGNATGGGTKGVDPESRTLVERARYFFSRDAIVAGPGYNRYLSVPASFAVQLSVGSVYAWSVFNAPLMREYGVVAAAEKDWELGSVIPIFSTCALTLGFTTALLGTCVHGHVKAPCQLAAANLPLVSLLLSACLFVCLAICLFVSPSPCVYVRWGTNVDRCETTVPLLFLVTV